MSFFVQQKLGIFRNHYSTLPKRGNPPAIFKTTQQPSPTPTYDLTPVARELAPAGLRSSPNSI
jgi:hypothetical protein